MLRYVYCINLENLFLLKLILFDLILAFDCRNKVQNINVKIKVLFPKDLPFAMSVVLKQFPLL